MKTILANPRSVYNKKNNVVGFGVKRTIEIKVDDPNFSKYINPDPGKVSRPSFKGVDYTPNIKLPLAKNLDEQIYGGTVDLSKLNLCATRKNKPKNAKLRL